VILAIHQIQSIVRPGSIEEAWRRRLAEAANSRFLAGGIELVLYAPPTVTTLIDLSGLGMGGVRRDGDDLVIGAMATLTEVLESPLAGSVAHGFLGVVLRQVASPLQRNVATIGGAAVRAHPWSDIATALVVLGARLDVFDGGRRSLDLGERRDERNEPFPLVLAVRLPRAFGPVEAAFQKFARTSFDVALLNCACSLLRERGTCHDVRVVVGGTPAVAQRLSRAEGALSGQRLTAGTMAAAAREAAGEVDARDDRRATGEYRRRLTEIGMRRCLAGLNDRTGRAS
jgi:carbon-monoxide dehydrogenase medium subunit